MRGTRRYPRSMSVQLSHDGSLTMTRSVISAPILTSTSNFKVAAQEGVLCEECTGIDETTASEARILAEKIQAEEAKEYLENPRRRFVDVLKDKLRRRDRTDFAKIEEEPGLTRRRAETINLCKDKIKNLTGNGHIKRKSMGSGDKPAFAEQHHLTRKESQAALITSRHDELPLDLDPTEACDESNFGSLTRSFNSALEKLDLQTTNVPFLRSRSSFFSVMRAPGEKQEGVPSVEPLKVPNTPRPGFRQLDRSVSITPNLWDKPDPSTDKPSKTFNNDESSMKAAMFRKTQTSEMKYNETAMTGGDQKTQKYKTIYAGGHPDGLRSHPDMMVMSKPPTTQEEAKEERRIIEDRNRLASHFQGLYLSHDGALDEAPVYSPSTGDLTQYSLTPPPKKTISTPDLTPTKPEREVKKRKSMAQGLKKSFSRINLLGKDESPPPLATRGSTPMSIQATTPSKPSPLRNVTQAQDKSKRRGMVFNSATTREEY